MTDTTPAPDPSAAVDLRARVAELEARIHEFHRTELDRWAESVLAAQDVYDQLQEIKDTLSWRITAPLRVIRGRQLER